MKASAIFLLSLALLSVACASKSKKTVAFPPLPANGLVELRLKAKKGDRANTLYHSHSAIEDFEEGQKTRDHQEILDFLVSTEVVESRDQQFTSRTQTIEKDGVGSLHDFAFPEPEEKIDFIYERNAKVLRADPYPKQSIFFMPPVSLPKQGVKIGDTWTMNHVWVSASDGLPLILNLVTIFKNIVDCGDHGRCADLEVSGRVEVVNEKIQKLMRFDSRLWGRLLFSIDRGDVVWSEVRSNDVFRTSKNEMHVLSCMTSRLQNAARQRVHCEPSKRAVITPNLTF